MKKECKHNLLPERLKLLRKENGLTQQQLADELGLNSVTYLRYEKGQREPSIDQLIAFASYFDVTVGYLVGAEEY